ncbi:hypothetical protein [Clostridium sp. LP20]|uniref:portal protein n=1 Tax=Clostridium sp. LP20 TaxID=3418665 RepID=UPI003EE4758A
MSDSPIKEWKLYEAGKSYNGKLDPPYYKTVDTNIDFYNGNQWKNLKSNGMPTPVFNILKRGVTFFVSSLMSSRTKVQYTPLEYREDAQSEDGTPSTADIATSEVDNLFDKFKMDNRIRDALFDAAVMGDVAAHIYFDPDKKPYNGQFEDIMGEIEFELVDGTNVYLGNANNPIITTSTQPYVIISGRDLVKNLKREAELHEQQDSEITSIQKDSAKEDMPGSKDEIDIESDEYGKANYIIYYRYDKDTKTIKVTKCTEKAYIYKDIDTGLSYYPVSWLVWEKQKNQYHGRAVCTSMIPNQIFINRMFAMVMYHLMMSAFPKAVYNGDVIKSFTNEIGSAIKVTGMNPGDNIKNYASYMEPGNMSNQIVQVLELAIKYTKETLGINDAMMGDVNPEKTSGKAIIATVNQAVVPLENVRANLYEWIENIGVILLDMMGTYYGERPMVLRGVGSSREVIDFNFDALKDTYLRSKCDVGPSTYWSELAAVETLDNLFENGAIELIEYLESMPDGYIPNKQELIDKIKTRIEEEQRAQELLGQMNLQGGVPPVGDIIPAN